MNKKEESVRRYVEQKIWHWWRKLCNKNTSETHKNGGEFDYGKMEMHRLASLRLRNIRMKLLLYSHLFHFSQINAVSHLHLCKDSHFNRMETMRRTRTRSNERTDGRTDGRMASNWMNENNNGISFHSKNKHIRNGFGRFEWKGRNRHLKSARPSRAGCGVEWFPWDEFSKQAHRKKAGRTFFANIVFQHLKKEAATAPRTFSCWHNLY